MRQVSATNSPVGVIDGRATIAASEAEFRMGGPRRPSSALMYFIKSIALPIQPPLGLGLFDPVIAVWARRRRNGAGYDWSAGYERRAWVVVVFHLIRLTLREKRVADFESRDTSRGKHLLSDSVLVFLTSYLFDDASKNEIARLAVSVAGAWIKMRLPPGLRQTVKRESTGR